jgi:hypothetical protein
MVGISESAQMPCQRPSISLGEVTKATEVTGSDRSAKEEMLDREA